MPLPGFLNHVTGYTVFRYKNSTCNLVSNLLQMLFNLFSVQLTAQMGIRKPPSWRTV